MNVAIIGAGPSALSAAYELSKNGVQVDLYEKSNVVGGLARSIELWETTVELGPHFLIKDQYPEVYQLLDMLAAKEDLIEFERLTRIYWKDRFIKYPPQILDLIKNIGAVNTLKLASFFAYRQVRPKKTTGTLESYVTGQMGDFIFTHFFRDYTEKLWGMGCHEINDDYAKILIGVGNLNFTALAKKLITQDDNRASSRCIYPAAGMSFFWKQLQQLIEAQNGRFYFSSPPARLICHENRITAIALADGTERQYDAVISTIPESSILELLGNAPTELVAAVNSIQYRNVICVFALMDPVDFIPDNNLYIYNPKMQCVRITNYSRFRNEKANKIIMLEYWKNSADAIWRHSNDQLMQIVQKDLSFLPGSANIKIKEIKVVRLKKAYPVPDMKIKQIITQVGHLLATYNNLFLTGRANQINFNYGMADALLDGLTTAQKILKTVQANNI